MTKRHFIALADAIRHNETFTPSQIESLAQFCQGENFQFNKSRWIAYIKGECGPSGGKIKE